MASNLFYIPTQLVQGQIGLPAGAALVYLYYTGTTTKAPIYVDEALTTPAVNPVTADAFGRIAVTYLDASITYRVVITDKSDNPIGIPVDPYLPGSITGLISIENGLGKFLSLDANGNPVLTDLSALPSGAIQDSLGSATTIAPSQNAVTTGLLNKAQFDLSNITAVNHSITTDSAFAPVGNGLGTYTCFNFLFNDQHNDQREFMAALGANFTHGGGGDPTYQWDKVLQYLGVTVGGLVKQAWIFNYLMHIDPPTAGNSYTYLNGGEIDIDNFSGTDFGSALGSAGLSSPSLWGLTFNTAGPNTMTGAIGIISSTSGSPRWQFGVVGTSGAIVQAFAFDISGATTSYLDAGTHTIGVDLSGATYSVAAIRLPNNKGIISRNNNNTADTAIIRVDSSNEIVIGDSVNGSNIVLSNNTLPQVTNTYQLGSATAIMSEVHGTRFVFYPPASDAPVTNGELRVQLTSNTSLTFKVKGSDGTIRSASLAL